MVYKTASQRAFNEELESIEQKKQIYNLNQFMLMQAEQQRQNLALIAGFQKGFNKKVWKSPFAHRCNNQDNKKKFVDNNKLHNIERSNYTANNASVYFSHKNNFRTWNNTQMYDQHVNQKRMLNESFLKNQELYIMNEQQENLIRQKQHAQTIDAKGIAMNFGDTVKDTVRGSFKLRTS